MLLVLSFLSGCGSIASAAPKEGSAPNDVQRLAAESRSVPRTLRLTGTLLPSREAHVAADAAGKIAGTFVERGDPVRQGDPLVRLEARAHDTPAAAAALVAAKALGDAVIRAPFSGMVAERGVELGEYVVPGTRVATLVELATLRLELSVPEPALEAARADGAVLFTVAAYPERRFSARVRHVGPVSRASRDQIVEVIVDNTDGLLRPGMFAVAQLTVGVDPLPIAPQGGARSAKN